MAKTLERFNIDIATGSRSKRLPSIKLDAGVYNGIQVINRFNNNLDKAIEIEITDGTGREVLPSVDTRYLEPAGGTFNDSKADIRLQGNQNINIELTAHENLDADGSYQVIFIKDLQQC